MANQKDTYARIKLETEQDVQTYNEFGKAIEREKIDSKEKIAKLTRDRKFLANRIKDNNKYLKERKLDTVEFIPAVKNGKKVSTIQKPAETP